ncbi:hypothetical protein PTSG_01091 [Salpingoeca rosetta]|uniref:Uncharacterized protein n=1 Tax=Salpingoeca rosetta (strain ATCC 50818 / BSB-021) TaxID=946362 RepID=F2U0S6_SALR5|nr:uncharacterized protein PTSG_01091 [Salpingoeca rosetta]EGD80500.1 hypothetical protein PTSG_01091 [Salpingoeca rosetta]|eukprot:XP_004997061.1 hypothetical protein PTSG_01091 [Salpingoeca rosetta]
MMGQFKNFVHNDNIWRKHCAEEVHRRKNWSSRWGFYADEMQKLKEEQQRLSPVKQTSYTLSYNPELKPRPDSKDRTQLKLPPIHPPPRNHANNSSSSNGATSRGPTTTKSTQRLAQTNGDTTQSLDASARSPLSLTSRAVGSRIEQPLEKYGAYCRGKCTAEKALGWPRY